jgi:phosphate transport system permease protein
VLPYATPGIIGAVILGLGRALGETMAVTFVIGNAFNRPDSIFSPSNSIASALANEFNEAGGLQKSALLELGLILFLITTVVLALSKFMLLRLSRREGTTR